MTTQQRGTVTTWKDDRGFGFITPDAGGAAIFFHASDLTQRRVRPSMNSTVFYTLIQDEQQRPRAINVRLATGPSPQTGLTIGVVGVFFLLLLLATYSIPLTPWIVIVYSLSSLVTCGLYALDKAQAIQGAQRIPENVLHLFELGGGWPGALIAQQYYRHKTVKTSYRLVFWLVVITNLVYLIGYSYLQLRSGPQ